MGYFTSYHRPFPEISKELGDFRASSKRIFSRRFMLRPAGGVIFGETVMMSSVYLGRGNSTQKREIEEKGFILRFQFYFVNFFIFAGRVGARQNGG